jgi:hypothetical protein
MAGAFVPSQYDASGVELTNWGSRALSVVFRLPLRLAGAALMVAALLACGGDAAAASPTNRAPANPVTATPVTATEGGQFSGQVGTFLSCGPGLGPASAAIDWGDGTASAATLTMIRGTTTCDITATHTYPEEGTYTTTVGVTVGTQPPMSATATATVADAALSLAARSLSGVAGNTTSDVVASLQDDGGLESPSQYAVTINWGDGQSSAGTIAANGDVSGSHTCTAPGAYVAMVAVTDDGGQSVSTESTASIVAPAPPTCSATPPTAAPRFTPTAGSPDARWVQAVYHDLLAKSPDPGDLAAFTSALSRGTAREVVVSFLEGDPDRPLIVGSLYDSYLRRPPDPTELNSGIQFLALGGSDEQLAATLLGSSEYLNSRGGGTSIGFLGSLYCDVLHRAIDTAALNSWKQALAMGATRQHVALAALSSPEYRGVLIDSIYLRFLRRPPEPSERSYWLGAFGAGVTDQQALSNVLSSQEYFNQFIGGRATLVNPTISKLGVIHVALNRPANLQLRVLALLPAVQRALIAATPTLSVPRTRLLGTVQLGHYRTGRVTIRWNRRIGRDELHPGRYVLLLEARSGQKLRDVSDALVVTLRSHAH